jgi:hypothetical protein
MELRTTREATSCEARDRILGFLDLSHYFFPELNSRG